MARYRCPSASYEDIGAAGHAASSSKDAVATSPRAKERANPLLAALSTRPIRKRKDKGKASVVLKQTNEEKAKEQARAAQKKELVRAAVSSCQQSYIYVGNLNPEVTDMQLRQIFGSFGSVQSVIIRSARGCPRTMKPGMSIKGKGRQFENRMYASVVFKHPGAVHRAMEMNGIDLNGQPITVVRDALDLPEFKEIINGHTGKARPSEPTLPSLSGPNGLRDTPALPKHQPVASSSHLRAQTTTARIAHQFRSRANGAQAAPYTRAAIPNKKR